MPDFLTFDYELGVKVTRKFVKYPPRHVTNAPAKCEFATWRCSHKNNTLFDPLGQGHT